MEGWVVSWTDRYQKEHRATWEDIAEAIHGAVTMDEVVRMYTPDPPPRYHRIPCPIHSGKDYNLSYTDTGYKCFVCGASGDVVSFVKDVLGLSTRVDAMKRINTDFRLHLPIDTNITFQESEELRQRREAVRMKQQAAEDWLNGIEALWDVWCRLDRQKRECEPGTDPWIEAVKNIDEVAYQIDCYPEKPR